MLRIINDLSPFFEDCYRKIHVREYAKIMKISPPTASKILESYQKEGILDFAEDRNYFFYFANRNNGVFLGLSKIYWSEAVFASGLIDLIEKETIMPVVILFGSASKAEVVKNSDIDIAIFTPTSKKITLDEPEKKLKRKIQLFIFKKIDDVKNKDLLKSVINGYKLRGDF